MPIVDYKLRRKILSQTLTIDVPIVLTAYAGLQRKSDTSHTFEQESNFWYLTGINEPGWLLIMTTDDSCLVSPNVSETHRLFDGGMSSDSAQMISGVDRIISHREAKELLTQLSHRYKTVQTLGPDPRARHYNFVQNPAPAKLRSLLKKYFTSVEDCRPQLAKLRAIKHPAEIEAIQRAVDLTVQGFDAVKHHISQATALHEYNLEATFTHHFISSGHHPHAYDPIIAAGANACTLHYNQNNDRITDGLVLMDVGASVDGYAADITRTYAVGTPTDRQIAVHAAVQRAHHAIIDLLHPGLMVVDYLSSVDQIMKDELSGLGLLTKESDYRRYFPHAISHGLGIDVHDTLGSPESFQPGLVLTVEPGIYIPEEGIGVRIEDDILITLDGHHNLSAHLSTDL